MICISNMKHIFPKYIEFPNCPFCGEPFPTHKVRVIRLLSNTRKGKYAIWCKNEPFKLHTLYNGFAGENKSVRNLDRAFFDDNGFEHTSLLEFRLDEYNVSLTRIEPFQNVYKFKDVYHWKLSIGKNFTKVISNVDELQDAFRLCGIDKDLIVF